MRRALMFIVVIMMAVAPACSHSHASSSKSSTTVTTYTSRPAPVTQPEYRDTPNTTSFCDDQRGVCADFPVDTVGQKIDSTDRNPNSTHTGYHRLESTVSFTDGDPRAQYCGGVKTLSCEKTETYTVDIYPDNDVNISGVLQHGDNCTFSDATVTGSTAQLESCEIDGAQYPGRLIVFANGYIYVAAAESSDGQEPGAQEQFFASIGIKSI